MKLVSKGRAKGFGEPWSPEEHESLVAIAQATNLDYTEIAPYIKEHGPLTVEQYRDLTDTDAKAGEKPDAHKHRKELEVKATALGVEFLPQMPDARLRELVAEAEAAAKTPKSDDTNTNSDAGAGDDTSGDDANAGGSDTAGDSTGDQGGDVTPPTRAELEAKATALGLTFAKTIGDAKLAERIAAAEAADNGA